jgi:hypothetical protein
MGRRPQECVLLRAWCWPQVNGKDLVSRLSVGAFEALLQVRRAEAGYGGYGGWVRRLVTEGRRSRMAEEAEPHVAW